MKIQEKTGKGLEARLDEIAGRLRRKEITVPTDLLGAALFLILAALILYLMPGQVPVSEADVVNEGNPELLQAKCRELGLGCDIIPKVEIEGITVSSTYIRSLVQTGDMERAALFLGHPHCLSQTVGHGFRFGRTIGIPTVNLTVPGHVLVPGRGVYISRVTLADGRSFAGVTNVGTRPTVSDSDAVSVETFLIDFDGDLYGQQIRLDFYRRLRPEKKFDSVDALRREIEHNIDQTRT